jgi:hypothetical protein
LPKAIPFLRALSDDAVCSRFTAPKKTKHVSEHGRERDGGDRSHWIEWFNEVDRLDHVRPENEIDDVAPSRSQQEVTK